MQSTIRNTLGNRYAFLKKTIPFADWVLPISRRFLIKRVLNLEGLICGIAQTSAEPIAPIIAIIIFIDHQSFTLKLITVHRLTLMYDYFAFNYYFDDLRYVFNNY